MKRLIILHFLFAISVLANAQTIPKSIDKTETPKTQKAPQKVVVKRKPDYIEKKKDSDADGVTDEIDECPDSKGTSKNNGCPEPELSTIKQPEMVFIPGGSFAMGNETGFEREKFVHQVTVSSFYIGKYEITQAQWESVMGYNPSEFKNCSSCPVENVSWNDIQKFLKKINAVTGKNYRLPKEAEWEYAAKGGENYFYSGSNDLGEVAWHFRNSLLKTHPVGQKLPNGYSLYDMSGNVLEYCSDWYDENYYSNSPSTNPTGSSSGTSRIFRGGSWNRTGIECRVFNRFGGHALDRRIDEVGFRVVISD